MQNQPMSKLALDLAIAQSEFRSQLNTQLNSTQPEITDAGVWHLYVRIIINKTIL